MVTWARLLTLLAALLLATCTTQVRSDGGAAAKALALESLNVTMGHYQRISAQCAAASATGRQALLQQLEETATGVLEQQNCSCEAASTRSQITARIQLDTCALGPRMQQAKDAFNRRHSDVHLSILETPTYNSSTELSFNRPSLPADGRWTDYVGTTTGDLAVYKDPTNTHMNNNLFYRRDLLEAAGLPVPQTWQELIETARALNGTDFDRDGQPDYALCFNFGELCLAPYFMIQSIITLTNYQRGAKNSWVFDPTTLQPRGKSAAVQAALELAAALNAFNNPAASLECYPYSNLFCKGKCAMTLNSDQFLQSNKDGCTAHQGQLGSALVPGSTHVLNHTDDTLVPCTPDLCPYAIPALRNKSTWVNHVPFRIPVLYNLMPNPKSDPAAAAALGSFAIFFSSLYSGYYDAYNRATNITAAQPQSTAATSSSAADLDLDIADAQSDVAVRAAEIAVPAATDPRPLLRMGYNLIDAVGFLYIDAQVAPFQNHYRGTKMPGGAYFRIALGEAATNALQPGANLTELMLTINRKFSMVIPAFGDFETYRALYWASIGYTPPPPVPRGSQKGPAWRRSHTIGTVVGGILVLALGLLVWYVRRQSREGRTLLGKLRPPGIGPCTTLLVTDIQDSTGMWERLPAELMEEALAVHHVTLQKLLDSYRGYESATEGDSFILAFHSPHDALAYAVAAQQALLEADWPFQLLAGEPLAESGSVRVMHANQDARLSKVVASMQRATLSTPRSASCASSPLHDPSEPPSTNTRRLQSKRLPTPGLIATLSAHIRQWVCVKRHGSSRRSRLGSNRGAVLGSSRGADLPSWVDNDAAGDGGERGTGSSPDWGAPSSPQETKNCSFGWAIAQAWADAEPGESPLDSQSLNPAYARAPPILIWRGLRVRMGLHSGLFDSAAISTNSTTHRTQYSGSFLATAKLVCDSGHGGQVVLSHSAFEQLGPVDPSRRVRVLLMGEHVLGAGQAPVCLYQATVPGLEPRLQSFPALRSKQVVAEGVMLATVGQATVVFMNASGVQLLMAWNTEVTQAALQMYHAKVRALLVQYGGYTPELVDGLALAVFQRPEDAIKWALAVQKELLGAPWPTELLRHELCEPVMTTLAITDEAGQFSEVQKLALRGLRLKAGIATGEVLDYISPATARIMYRGRVMNWAARISALASAGQVLCSQICWQHATSSRAGAMSGISAVGAGMHLLKGLHMPLNLYSCTYTQAHTSGTLSFNGSVHAGVAFNAEDDNDAQLATFVEGDAVLATGMEGGAELATNMGGDAELATDLEGDAELAQISIETP